MRWSLYLKVITKKVKNKLNPLGWSDVTFLQEAWMPERKPSSSAGHEYYVYIQIFENETLPIDSVLGDVPLHTIHLFNPTEKLPIHLPSKCSGRS